MVHTWLIILKYNFHTMKSILEINLDSKFDKALYSIHKQALATNLLPPQHYPVDSMYRIPHAEHTPSMIPSTPSSLTWLLTSPHTRTVCPFPTLHFLIEMWGIRVLGL